MDKHKHVQRAIFPHRLFAGLGMVLLAAIWAVGWFTPPDPYSSTSEPLFLMSVTALVLASWNLLACVIAAGFFHAGSVHPAGTFGYYRNASFRMQLMGLIMLFPVPIMAQVLGASPLGRTLAMLITTMSIAAILFGRARFRMIESRLYQLAGNEEEAASLEPFA